MRPEDDQHAGATAEAVARRSYGKLVAFLAARTSDVAGGGAVRRFAALWWIGPRAVPRARGMAGGGAAQADDAARRQRNSEDAAPSAVMHEAGGHGRERDADSDDRRPDVRLRPSGDRSAFAPR